MVPFYLSDPRDLSDALTLIQSMGDAAADTARARSNAGREIGNVVSFCRWRQIGRLIAFLSADTVASTIH